jgi:hypothetical protein
LNLVTNLAANDNTCVGQGGNEALFFVAFNIFAHSVAYLKHGNGVSLGNVDIIRDGIYAIG